MNCGLPLTAIKGSMEGLEDGVLPATPQTFQQVASEADRLSRLVDDLQELSRVESGSLVLDPGAGFAGGCGRNPPQTSRQTLCG